MPVPIELFAIKVGDKSFVTVPRCVLDHILASAKKPNTLQTVIICVDGV